MASTETYRKRAITESVKVRDNGSTENCELGPSDWKQLILCPVTGRPCEGDLAYLCPEYGCARKGGLSSRSEENF
jgi:hypothetical protein